MITCDLHLPRNLVDPASSKIIKWEAGVNPALSP